MGSIRGRLEDQLFQDLAYSAAIAGDREGRSSCWWSGRDRALGALRRPPVIVAERRGQLIRDVLDPVGPAGGVQESAVVDGVPDRLGAVGHPCFFGREPAAEMAGSCCSTWPSKNVN